MISLLIGTDFKKKKLSEQSLTNSHQTVVLSPATFSKETLLRYADEVSLFGESPIIVCEGVLAESGEALASDDLFRLSASATIFIFSEDTMLVSVEKKYKKYATIERFVDRAPKKVEKINVFDIASAFGRNDKIATWALYCQAIESGVGPEPISGILFWKVKSMLLSSPKPFTKEQLQHFSSELVSLYHRAHHGELDFTTGLEQFILKSL